MLELTLHLNSRGSTFDIIFIISRKVLKKRAIKVYIFYVTYHQYDHHYQGIDLQKQTQSDIIKQSLMVQNVTKHNGRIPYECFQKLNPQMCLS